VLPEDGLLGPKHVARILKYTVELITSSKGPKNSVVIKEYAL
jgi:hypothetical protein